MKFALSLLAFFATTVAFAERNPALPPPNATPSTAKPSKTIPWTRGLQPTAAPGFEVTLLASLPSPRSLYLMPNGDVLVSQALKSEGGSGPASPNMITRLKMNGSELTGTDTFLSGLNLPFGMALWKNEFFVGEPDRVLKYQYIDGKISGNPTVIAQLPYPLPQRHWTRHLLLSRDGSKLYVAVGSVSNYGEAPDPIDPRNAAILQMDLDGKNQSIAAKGLRNPVSMAWEPVKGNLWTVVNERDELGDDLVPDYLTRVLRGANYGWPWTYWGNNADPRLLDRGPSPRPNAITPDYSVGAHVAALGITFTTGTKMPEPFSEGALIAEHGSWNRSHLVGYRVHFVPFKNGEAIDGESDFLTGFIADDKAGTVYGRPVASVVLTDGSVLVSDDTGGKIWKVSIKK